MGYVHQDGLIGDIGGKIASVFKPSQPQKGPYPIATTHVQPQAQPKPSLFQKMHTPTMRAAGSAIAAFHGYKRHGSIGWAVVWSIMGSLSPVFTNVIAVAQGFGKKKGLRKNPGRRKWIKGAIKKKGALRSTVKQRYGQKGFDSRGRIKMSALNKLSKEGGKTGQRARLAKTLRKRR
jgi:hypothetical protein